VSADGVSWFLLNASPDVRDQLTRLPTPMPSGMRHVPIDGVVVTDAELDHTVGILLLREARRLQVTATDAVRRILEHDSRILAVTRVFAEVCVHELQLGRPLGLCRGDGTPSGLRVTGFPVPAGPPRFASEERPGHTIGLIVQDEHTGTSCAFVPGCGDLDDELLARLSAADLVLFDGTFWTDDELIGLGIGERTAREMDHLPISGPDGSLERLRALASPHRVYTHINNTNPMLLEDSPERARVEEAGFQVGADGMRFTL
jgi:pyrroloquinoline quinone biosynthesis protein B